MNLTDAARTTTFRWSLAVAAALLLQSAALSGIFYWLTARHATEQVYEALRADCRSIDGIGRPAIIEAVRARVDADIHRINLVGLFDAQGAAVAGNIARLPRELLAANGPVVVGLVRTEPPDPVPNMSLAIACPLEGGAQVVFARDTDELDYISSLARRALMIVTLPVLLISAVLGIFLSQRALTRFSLVEQAIAHVVAGDLKRRLPARSSSDPYDRLSRAVNAMLDRLEAAINDLRGLGDDIAHELRTPLTRLRARLERGSRDATKPEDFQEVGDLAIRDVDHALMMISAILRIRAIEEARKASQFAQVDARKLLHDAADLYRPSADLRHISIEVANGPPVSIHADRDLMMEAICNLIDNSIKFVPEGGAVRCSVTTSDGLSPTIRVADNGPGIAEADRESVFRRFHRSRAHPSTEGHGIGLSIVASIVRLHHFTIKVSNAEPGCEIAIGCSPATASERLRMLGPTRW